MKTRLGLLLALWAVASAPVSAITFSEWTSAHFTTPQLADTLISGPNADPDSDGVWNLHEYAFFGHPFTIDTYLAPTLSFISNTVTLTYRERHAMTDVSIRLQGSNTLTSWITYNTVIEADRETFADYDEVTLLDPVPFDNSRRFLRLRVELQPVPNRVHLCTFP